jgi:hypothetical protein
VIVQSFVIAYFGFWMYENYQNDFYFQAYVNSSLQSSGFAIVALGSVGVFSAVASGLFMKLRQTRRELAHLAMTEAPTVENPGTGSVLSPHVEQHLIEMIRKSTTTDTASGSLPVLKREEPSGQAR